MTQGTSVVYNPGVPPTTPISEKKSLLRTCSKLSFFFSLLTIGGGVAEIYLATGDIKDCRYLNIYPFNRDSKVCSYRREHVAAGIWCSIVPFLAALVGICSGGKKTTAKRMGNNYNCPVAGAISMGLLALLEHIYLSEYHTTFRTIQIALMVVALLNMTLFIIMSGLMCCMGGCCQVHDDAIPMTEIGALPLVNGTTTDVLTNQAGSTVEASQPQQPTVVVIPSSGNDAPPPKYSS